MPDIVTNRLLLRPHVPSDLRDSHALWTDANVLRFIGGEALSEQAVWFRLLRHAGQWALLGYGPWVVIDRASGAFLGEVGLMEARRGFAALEGVPEMGWVMAASAQGRGLGREAVQAALDWVDAHIDAPATRCIIDPDNSASLRLARICGYHDKGRIAENDTALILMERERRRGDQAASG